MRESSTPPSGRPFWHHPRRTLVTFLIAAAMLLSAATITINARSANAGTSPPKYTGEALISGLIYGIGPVAEQYPRLVLGRGALVDRDGTTAFLPRLFAETERIAPGYRTRFANALYGGDRWQIKQVTVGTIKALGDALVTLLPELEPLLRHYNSDSSGQATWYYENDAVYADAYAVIEFIGAIGAVVAVTVVLSVIDFTPSQPDPTSSEAALLQLEVWSDTVARTLSR